MWNHNFLVLFPYHSTLSTCTHFQCTCKCCINWTFLSKTPANFSDSQLHYRKTILSSPLLLFHLVVVRGRELASRSDLDYCRREHNLLLGSPKPDNSKGRARLSATHWPYRLKFGYTANDPVTVTDTECVGNDSTHTGRTAVKAGIILSCVKVWNIPKDDSVHSSPQTTDYLRMKYWNARTMRGQQEQHKWLRIP